MRNPYLMDLKLRFLLVWPVTIPRARQACATLSLQLHLDSADSSIGVELNNDLACDEVEIGEMGMWSVEMDSGRHVCLSAPEAGHELPEIEPAVAPPRRALSGTAGKSQGSELAGGQEI